MNVLLTLWHRVALILALCLATGCVVMGLRQVGLLEGWELRVYDATTTRLARAEPLPDVALLAVTDDDLARWGWPLPDARLAEITRAALQAGASAVGVDIYRDVPVGDGRAALLKVLQNPKVTVISRLKTDSASRVAAPPGVTEGFADIPIDADGVARRALLLVNTENGLELSFALRIAMAHLSQSGLQAAPDAPETLQFGDTVVPRLPETFGPYRSLDNAGYQVMTRYRHERPMVMQLSAQELIAGTVDLAGKSLIIAVTSDTVKDYFRTPLNRQTGSAFSFGGEVHAASVQQIIDHAERALPPLSVPRSTAARTLIFAAAFGGVALAAFLPVSLIAFTAAIATALALLGGLSLAQTQGILMPAVPVTLAWSLGYGSCFALLASMAWRQRRVMAGIFASQLSESLSADLWRQRKRLIEGHKPVSRKLFVTILLADIEGSTRAGQKLEPASFMTWISNLLDALGACAQRHGGFVEKYTGDGILVVFGAPIPRETEAEHAADARAALACAEDMRDLARNLSTSKNGPAYRLRIALNSGEVVAGTLGAAGAMRYNVIGDTVNVTARLETWIKSQPDDARGTRPICMTGTTAHLIGTRALGLRPEPLLHDDGKTQIAVYSRD